MPPLTIGKDDKLVRLSDGSVRPDELQPAEVDELSAPVIPGGHFPSHQLLTVGGIFIDGLLSIDTYQPNIVETRPLHTDIEFLPVLLCTDTDGRPLETPYQLLDLGLGLALVVRDRTPLLFHPR